MDKLSFKQGIKDGFPICLGYISVAIAFGVLAVGKKLPPWAPPLISALNFSGTGQFAFIDLYSATAAYLEIACAIIIINARYFLMSVSLSQRLPSEIKQWQRYIIAFGNTDEVYAVAMGQALPLNFKYMLGLSLCAYAGWTGGTVIGVFGGNIVPEALSSAFGISLYAMFLAIIIPPATASKPITFAIVTAAAVSCLFFFIPALGVVSGGWVIIISGVGAAALTAVLFPISEVQDEH